MISFTTCYSLVSLDKAMLFHLSEAQVLVSSSFFHSFSLHASPAILPYKLFPCFPVCKFPVAFVYSTSKYSILFPAIPFLSSLSQLASLCLRFSALTPLKERAFAPGQLLRGPLCAKFRLWALRRGRFMFSVLTEPRTYLVRLNTVYITEINSSV